MIIYCLSYAHDIMIWITRSLDLHSDNIITIDGPQSNGHSIVVVVVVVDLLSLLLLLLLSDGQISNQISL